jgi:hypothetical protein
VCVRLMAAVWDHGPTVTGERGTSASTMCYVLVKLADNANSSGFAYPSIEDIVEKTRLSKRTVIRAIDDLSRGAWIRVVPHGCPENRRINAYQLNLSSLKLPDSKVGKTSVVTERMGAKVTLHPSASTTPESEQSGATVTLGEVPPCQTEVPPCLSSGATTPFPQTPYKEEPSGTIKEPRTRSCSEDSGITAEMVAQGVADEIGGCHFTQLPKLVDAARWWMIDHSATETRTLMVQQWQEFLRARAANQLQWGWGSPSAFFSSGQWHDPRLWPFKDGQKISTGPSRPSRLEALVTGKVARVC